MRITLLIIIVLTLIGPLWVLASGQINLNDDWRTASRVSAHLAPDPKVTSEAVIQVYAARAFNWRGLFAVHTWMAVKPQNAKEYMVYQVIGWRVLQGLSPLVIDPDVPDRYWFGQKPYVVFDKRGEAAETLIPKIAAAAKAYPDRSRYVWWPGPNSNTFLAYIARQIPQLGLVLPANAFGKDYLPKYTFFARTPSGSGYQFSLFGVLGIAIAKQEGLEINVLGFIYGINPCNLSIALPGVGQIGFKKQI